MAKYKEYEPENKVNPSDPMTIPKFIDPLPIPAIARSVYKCNSSKELEEFYKIVMEEALHRFHSCFPLTTIWGYNGTYPGPTIEVDFAFR